MVETKVESTNSSQTVTGTVGEYSYDGDGKRVKKYVPSTGETTIFVYDASGKSIAEYATIVASTNDAKVAYLTNDHLGSPRINTDANGAVIARHDYHPFGEEIATAQRTPELGFAADTVRKQFTGYERDTESGLEFAQARMYASKLGRFTSVDPENFGAFEDEPQSWNAYVYVGNNPTNYFDPSGLIWVTQDNKNYTWIEDGYYNSVDGQREYGEGSGWFNGNGEASYIGSLHGNVDTPENQYLIGNFATHNSDGSLSYAGSRGPDGSMILPVLAGSALTLPTLLAGGGAEAVGIGGVLAGSGTALVIAGGVLGAGFLIWNGPDVMSPRNPATLSTPNSASNVAISSISSSFPNCACAVPTIMHMANREQRQIAHAAKKAGISYKQLTDAIHDYKESVGRGGADNLTLAQIKEIAAEVADHLGAN